MNITIIADPVLPVPPRGYGGCERVVAELCRSLRGKGHRITLLAAEGSENFGRLIVHSAPDNRSFRSRAARKILFQLTSTAAGLNADVIHNFGRVDYLWALLKTRIPLVHTFVNPIAESELAFLLASKRPRLTLVSVSDHQRSGLSDRCRWATVYNAVNIDRLRFSPNAVSPPYLAFLGRLTHNKGVHVAIEVARRARLPLKIVGNISKELGGPEYFEARVRPEFGNGVEWVGDVLEDHEKAAFLGGAVALLFPILWDEPFAVVIGEALACGTPVIALRRASTPEALLHGKTGFLCASPDEMVAAVGRVPEIRREDCRHFAETVLATDVMADRYLSIYKQTIGTE